MPISKKKKKTTKITCHARKYIRKEIALPKIAQNPNKT